jgi:hypothetical protein
MLWLPAAILVTWALICTGVYFAQERLIFHPSRLPADHEYEFDRPFEALRIEVEPGVELAALRFPASGVTPAVPDRESAAGRRAVLYLHGNAGHLQDWGWHAGLYTDAGYDFVVVDYRGYGTSDGRIDSEAQLHSDVERVWMWMTERYAPGDVTLVGYSLGSALAARLACTRERPPGRLVLLAPFYSARDLARRAMPFVPAFLMRYPLRTDLVLRDCRLPVTIFHGRGDRTVPFDQGRRLADSLGERARLVELPEAGHSDIAADPVFRREMTALLARP